MDELRLLRMAAIMNPPRQTIATAIADFRSAGIKVFIVTIDNPSAAAAFTREVELIDNKKTVGFYLEFHWYSLKNKSF